MKKVFAIFSIMFVFLIILESSFHLLSKVLNYYSNQKISIAKNKKAYVILCIGESTTEGEFRSSTSYPYQLQKLLDQKYGMNKFIVINEGKTSSNTNWIVNNLEKFLEKHSPDLVISMMGINDTSVSGKPPFMIEGDLKLIKVARFIKNNLGTRIYYTISDMFRNYYVFSRIDPVGENFDQLMKGLNEVFQRSSIYLVNKDLLNMENRLFSALNIALSENDPSKLFSVYLKLGEYYDRFYYDQKEAFKYFGMALEIRPSSVEVNKFFFKSHIRNYDFLVAKRYLDVLAKSDLRDGEYQYLAGIYFEETGNPESAEAFFRESLRLNPKRIDAILYLGSTLESNNEENLGLAQDYYKLMISKNSASIDLKMSSGMVTFSRQKYLRSESIFRKLVDDYPHNKYGYYWLIGSLHAQGKFLEADPYIERVESLEVRYPTFMTKSNYLLVIDRLRKKGITHFIMQYPLRSMKALQVSSSNEKGITYISNDENFTLALKTKKRDDVFTDNFAGDFGHCTEYGYKLIASSIMSKMNSLFEKLPPSTLSIGN